MKRIVVATHGELSKTLIETVELIVGSQTNLDYFCMTKDKSGEAGRQELKKIIFKNNEDQVLIFTDVFGGSVNNICAELLMDAQDPDRIHLVSGVNLPMLLTAILSLPSNSVEAVVAEAIQEAKQGIKYINDLLKGGDN
ncbi:PTS sugar transporter subunit IIA [Sporolactobacillus terrae]|uniref:PTS mannose transporter subunit IIA n=1 Tax=Sporolactobacillus terrae TaxID=269673 RepID=A0A5K7WYY2_9BACL|nr:PTS mannose transporter subunit IIA [Sporolactobacillus terrae]BBN99835.1 PTS mannose transporter subunit IIA [Sporolactobacillus terrae]